MRTWWLAVAFCLAACRTEIAPLVMQAPSGPKVRLVDEGCEAADYPSGADVPQGAKNIGWVKVERRETDDATFSALREAVCRAGGNAFSQMRWIRAPGASVADPPIELEANAWDVP
ncbi:MAG: hypothetical protein INH41_14090 [Myxococcaceae bacterium]|jgi:hypothetical protein|nr:hypothetical protein [Myxococcaceae bacterium]